MTAQFDQSPKVSREAEETASLQEKHRQARVHEAALRDSATAIAERDARIATLEAEANSATEKHTAEVVTLQSELNERAREAEAANTSAQAIIVSHSRALLTATRRAEETEALHAHKFAELQARHDTMMAEKVCSMDTIFKEQQEAVKSLSEQLREARVNLAASRESATVAVCTAATAIAERDDHVATLEAEAVSVSDKHQAEVVALKSEVNQARALDIEAAQARKRVLRTEEQW